jgi:hypothetical protein
MKNLTFKILLVLLVLNFVSCKKNNLEPIGKTTLTYDEVVSPIGSNWELYSGRVFVKNLSNNSMVYYDHFNSSKNNSNLDVFVPSNLSIDNITKGMTNWKFNSSNQFILNNSTTYNYSLNSNNIFRVYGLENGSARIIEIVNCTNDYMNVKIYESNGNDGTNNYSFYTILTFVKVGSSSTPVVSDVPYGYTYGGVINNTGNTNKTLVGTKWVITKLVQNFATMYPNDTLEFVSTTQYKINRSSNRNYSLSGVVGNNMKSLSLYSFTTLGGDWSGQVQSTFIDDGVVNNSMFTDMFNVNSYDVRLWMTRIK